MPLSPEGRLQRQQAAAIGVQVRAAKQEALRQQWIGSHGPLPDLSEHQLRHPDWWAAEEARANKIIADMIARSVRAYGTEGVTEERKRRIRWNHHLWGHTVCQQRLCAGTEEGGNHEDQALCSTTPFKPADYFGKGGANHDFAHWARYKRNGNASLIIGTQAKANTDYEFVEFLKQGRFLRRACHNIESWCK